MSLLDLIVASTGVILMAMLTANALNRAPRLRKFEPIFMVCSLALVFIALLHTTSSQSQSSADRFQVINLSSIQ